MRHQDICPYKSFWHHKNVGTHPRAVLDNFTFVENWIYAPVLCASIPEGVNFRVRDNFSFIESCIFAHMICVQIRHFRVTADGDTYPVIEHFTFVENWISASLGYFDVTARGDTYHGGTYPVLEHFILSRVPDIWPLDMCHHMSFSHQSKADSSRVGYLTPAYVSPLHCDEN